MAAVEQSDLSLMSLEDELTCSICLSPFDCPVTIPCGHNFCQGCLLTTWTEPYRCPQCRTLFHTKPELKKNTVLSTVVEAFNLRLVRSASSMSAEEKETKEETREDAVIRCDTCMEAEAANTCLTCMVSFCEEHLRPHRENPVFRLHQLIEPVGDLLERLCPDHHKLMDLFCSQHVRPICSLCLQQDHKGCTFTSPEDQRKLKESELKDKLDVLNAKIVHNETIMYKMRDMEDMLKASATIKKKALVAEYQEMHDMLTQEESTAMNAVDREVETCGTKLNLLKKKFAENIDHMNGAKEYINNQLSQSQTLAFLQVSFNLPAAVNFDPYTPRINLDSKKVMANETFAVTLKDHLTELFKQPVESRLPLAKPGTTAASASGVSSIPCEASFWKPHLSEPLGNPGYPLCPSPDQGPQSKAGPKKKPSKQTKKPQPTEKLVGYNPFAEFGGKDPGRPPVIQPNQKTEPSDIPANLASAEKRSDLLKYASALMLDRKTAHKRILVTEECTKASVTDEQANYPNCPQRFVVCSQVLTSKGFSSGRHYWEVRLSCNNFIGIGLAYSSIDRKGSTSRLGRNAQSWCVEWFNVKLSAWHNSHETVLCNPNPKRVGVLLDYEGCKATFYNVADRAYPFHTFEFPFAQAVYPAFWMFSSGSSITLCKV
ncbi:E3 ubiquitin/ISG15 ligase TRIM25 isoform X2 [Platichthys flesus]|uniref:E3 ubiquitin/ISG15 ligase TRIM25 isoform X2 n=1 Tax=Platichthys flesus TaxID=8260 RepID=UPI002DBC7042|nr:E3 ubiquitin/ISG15 ligase TRIM25 isoform X2 [Platichthys flesus]